MVLGLGNRFYHKWLMRQQTSTLLIVDILETVETPQFIIRSRTIVIKQKKSWLMYLFPQITTVISLYFLIKIVLATVKLYFLEQKIKINVLTT